MTEIDHITLFKICKGCGEQKPWSEFSIDKKSSKPRSKCKVCCAAEARKRWRETPERLKEIQRNYRKTHPELIRERERRYKAAHPDKVREWDKKWKREHPDRVSAVKKNWYQNNLERTKESVLRWQKNNPERAKEFRQNYRMNHPDACNRHCANRRARQLSSGGIYLESDILKLREIQGDRCAICGELLCGGGHIDHIFALAKYGTNWPDNLQLLCKNCNHKKWAHNPVKFALKMGREDLAIVYLLRFPICCPKGGMILERSFLGASMILQFLLTLPTE